MAHALSDNWLTDDLTWDEGEKFDAPFLAGIPVRISEKKVVQWDDNPRYGFALWIGEKPEAHSMVLVVERPKRTDYTCSEHNEGCLCIQVVRAWMAK